MLKPADICSEVIHTYKEKSEYPVIKSIILGVLAGIFISIGAFAAALASHSIDNPGVAKLVAGAVFPVGLILIVFCGGDLFTSTCLMAVPCADKKVKFKRMLFNWIIIYISNFMGAIIFAILIHEAKLLDFNNFKLGGYALKVAITKSSMSFPQAFSSGILCNILVSVAVWVSMAAKDSAGKIGAIWFPIMAFIVGGFEHCVANMYYFTIALLNKGNLNYVHAYNLTEEKLAHLTIKGMVSNLIPVTLGNIIGGAVIIGLGLWFAFKEK